MGGCIPIAEGCRLDLRPLIEAPSWRFAPAGPQSHRQGARHGFGYGWRSTQRSSRGPPQGHREHRREGGDNAKRLRSNQCWAWEGIASVPTSKVMDVYNAFSGIL